MQYDTTVQMYFDQARWYDQVSGRFINPDPMGFGGRDSDLYRYVGNGPTNGIDPLGLADFTLGGVGYVWPWNWSPSWSGVGTTLGNYGQTVGVTAAGGAGGAATGGISGTVGGAGAGFLVSGGPAVIPAAGAGLVGGMGAGGFCSAWDALFNSPPGTTLSQALQTGEDKGWIPGLTGGIMGGMGAKPLPPSSRTSSAPPSCPTSGPRIVPDKQGKHIPGHKNFIPGRSELTHPDPQKLIDRFAGTGQPVGPIPRGQPGFKERVDFGGIIGEFQGQPTTNGIIHYGGNGVHIVPSRP